MRVRYVKHLLFMAALAGLLPVLLMPAHTKRCERIWQKTETGYLNKELCGAELIEWNQNEHNAMVLKRLLNKVDKANPGAVRNLEIEN